MNRKKPAIEIKQPGEDEMEQCFDLRWRVLREPWDQPRGSERDEKEKEGFHVAAFEGCKVVGTARLQVVSPGTARIRYMAVEEEWRGRGAGSALLRALEKRAVACGMSKVMLNARENAVGFYEKQGYRVTGEAERLYGVIRHFRMEKEI